MTDKIFLKILNAALRGEKVVLDAPLSGEEIREIFATAELHRVLPLILDSVCDYVGGDEDALYQVKQRAKFLILSQALRTQSFLELYRLLSKAGFEPVVIKGIVCRSLYPTPDFRPSSDEDMYIPEDKYLQCVKYMRRLGFKEASPFDENHYESVFVNDDGMCVELHRAFFSINNPYFNKYNEVFASAYSRSVYVEIESQRIRTLSPDDHLMYLIMHSLKHFIRCGVGIRQICDIIQFANAYAESIDWGYIHKVCGDIGAVGYATALFNIGRNYLNLDCDKAGLSEYFDPESVDEEELLRDVMTAGLYGNTDKGRAHSASVTLNAMQGKKETWIRKAFPSVRSIDRRFSYVRRCPLLLPVAWAHRLVVYLGEASIKKGNTPARSMKIGHERTRLLKKYGLVQK